jgi:hypothetical protein
MSSDVKLMLFGFLSGLAVGALALTSVSAAIEGRASRGDRLAAVGAAPAPNRPLLGDLLSYDDVVALPPKALAGDAAVAPVEYFDARGVLTYRSDPATATTTVAKGTVIPTPTPVERDAAFAAQRVSQAAPEEGKSAGRPN